jgi:hypothetical protein
MDSSVSTAQAADPQDHDPVAGPHPSACRKPAGRRSLPGIDAGLSATAAAGVVRKVFPDLNARWARLPDPRRAEMCRYTASHLWWSGTLMFLTRNGSRHAFDQTRNSGQAPHNMGQFCGQQADDPRFDGHPQVTCSDNLTRHLKRVDSVQVQGMPADLCEQLLSRRLFDSARLFGCWHVLLFDGTVQETCRQGFAQGGKRGGPAGAPYRYVLQCGLLGPGNTFFPLLHEHVDMYDPSSEKEDCELNAFFRLAQRLKARFPRLRFCIVGDALFCTEGVAACCQSYGWKYVLTLKEGRQPGLWEELLALLPLSPQNLCRVWRGQDGQEGLRDLRWVEQLPLGAQQVTVILSGELIARGEATLYAYVTNLLVTRDRVLEIVSSTGRERHPIEDYFNTAKNNGIGLEHVFCANANASKNFFTLMQVAAILWTIICHGYLKRVFDWAARATQTALAHAIAEGLRGQLLPAALPQPGQLRFVT